MVTVTWLGQAGLLFNINGKLIVSDPYLSDNVKKYEPWNARRVPVDEKFFALKPDAILVTHKHIDHLDKETLKYYLTEDSSCLVLAPCSSADEMLHTFGGGKNNYVVFDDGTFWTEDYCTFRAVKAVHSDADAVGFILTIEGKHYYITGDTLYSELVLNSLPDLEFEVVFLPINGVGNNMNVADAERFAKHLKARHIVPYHVGLFDDKKPELFRDERAVYPKIWETIPLT